MSSSISPQVAANAYANSMNAVKMASGDVTPVASEVGSFADLMKENVVSSINTIKAGEQMSAKAVTGKADMIDVVQAVNAAELTLQSVVALRDRMIGAYQDIMRMPI